MDCRSLNFKRTYFVLFLASAVALLSSFFHLPTHEKTCAELEKIEQSKQAWGSLLSTHPYYTRPQSTEGEREKIPASDKPDLAFELDYLKTMDPATGRVPYEKLYKANLDIDKLLSKRAPIAGVSWVERGPNNVGGRTRALMFDPNDPTNKKVWAGSVGGGLWYTNDITATNPAWIKIDDMWDNIAITTITYNPNNNQEFYAGTGEGWGNFDAQEGTGIWKSSNGGLTWTNLSATTPGSFTSSSDFHYVQKIVIKSSGTIFAATRGYFFNSGGIMRSTNGGTTWTKVLTVFNGSGTLYDYAGDIEIAANGDLYASFGIFSDGKVFKSTNANNGNSGTWTDLSSNIGIGNAQRVELACAPSNSNVVYAVAKGGSGINDVEWFKRSVDGGTTWSTLAIPRLPENGVTHFTNNQAWYDLIIAVHPSNPDYVLTGGINLHRSIDGGTTWSNISHWNGGFSQPYVHGDQHNIVFRPGASDEVIFTNDGGVTYSPNAGNASVTPVFMQKINGYDVTQFYSCATKNEVNSNYFLAGSQDNGTQKFTLPQLGSTTLSILGDGGFCHIDQANGNFQLASYVHNKIYRSTNGGNTFSVLFTQNTGLFINPSDYDGVRKILYATANDDLLKRVSGIDGIFTNVDLPISVGTSKVSAMKLSPYNDVLFLGISNSRIYKYTNASTASPTLTRIDNGSTPIVSAGWVSSIDVGTDDNHLMVTYSNYEVPSVWQTTDGGVHWYSKEGNLPDIPIRWAIYNPDNREQVLAATELGVWTTDNFHPTTSSAPTWGPGNAGLAHTRCDMLTFRPADKMIVIATHGRGLYTSDIFVTTSVADFIIDNNTGCTGSLTVHLTDASLKANASWAWDIDNNGTTDYTTQNPTHTYNTPGIYSVKLTINNGSTSITKQNLILVSNGIPTLNTDCTLVPNSNLGNNNAIGIYRFALANVDNITSNNDGYYQDYACSQAALLDLATSYNVTVRTGIFANEGVVFYIDYNDNGSFEAGESVVTFPANTEGTRTLSFMAPSSGVVTHKGLRSRVISNSPAVPASPCDIGAYGQAEDYKVYFNCTLFVTMTSGSASGSLLSAINCANSGDTIRISASMANQTINIGPSPVMLNKNLVFIGLGVNTNITGSGTSVFDISAGKTIEFQNLSITAGTSLTAGAVNNNGILKLNNVNVHRNAGVINAILLRNNIGANTTMVGMSFIWN